MPLTIARAADGVGKPEVQVQSSAVALALRCRPHAPLRPGVPFINPNVAAALGGGLGKTSDDDDDD